MTGEPSRKPTEPDADLASVEFKRAALEESVNGIRLKTPLLSAAVPFVRWQKAAFALIAATIVVGFALAPVATATVMVGLATFTYIATMLDRLVIFRRGLAGGAIHISDEQARAVPDDDLPPYTVLVPAYDEPEVVGDLVAAMESLEYPRAKLQIMLLLEEDDEVTIDAASGVDRGGLVTVILVPPADPRTKPKACNYGMHFATGEFVTIYDAEDIPDPLQLRRAVAAFAELDDTVACVQSRLDFHNSTDNILTAWFTADYGIWFGFLLPGLMASRSPIPLGGTSNHLRRAVLDDIGTWDPFNVTEDADLGVRIAASGYRTAVIDSVTLEEANIDAINWIRQRSRWYKGYFQTWLVHMRRPLALFRTLGPVGFFRFTTLFAGTPLIACANMLFWLLMITWILGQPSIIVEIFPPATYYPALVSLLIGNTATVYMNIVALREDDRSDLFWPALLVPAYWVLMSIAALKGMWQMLRNPSYWEKTFHGIGSSSRTTEQNPEVGPP
ncbi:glycosyltransferase [Gordonia soli]|uniref:Putative glycosyltransferase n=1 Tax=Gordonia soli NBRC 108243 TaxID=1223545 RepID=M0QCH7_9ACTN|nr:glycosyltransferase [Gordonia soli]GAC66265.1 putative glycosyltransferase [Gordonia soli NBRC 108243]